MGASGITLRLNRTPFNGVKTEYSENTVKVDTEDVQITKYQDYIPFDTTSDRVVSDFPNNLTKDK